MTGAEKGADAPLGMAGRLARSFQSNPLTPLLALVALLLGLFAVWVTPRRKSRRSTSRWPMC